MEKSLKEKKPVLIYCQLGCGRTGLLLTAYLMKFEGNIFQDAFKEIKQIKPCAIETHTQYEFLANLNIKL